MEDPIENKVRHIEALVGAAASVANTYHTQRVGIEHLLYVISGTEEGRRVIESLGGAPRRIRTFLEKAFCENVDHAVTGGTILTEELKGVTMRPIQKARENARAPDLRDILQEMIHLHKKAPIAWQALIVGGILETRDGSSRESYRLEEEDPGWDEADLPDGGENLSDLGGETVADIYDEMSAPDADHSEPESPETVEEDASDHARAVADATRDLTALARQGKLDEVIAREDEIDRMVETISKRKKGNMILSGEPGVGKSALAEGLATFLASPAAPQALRGRPVLEIALSDLVAGARFRGDFEARMQKLMDMARTRRAILFLDEIHLMVGAGSASARGGMDAANILKPALARGEITVIGATTPSELRDIRRDGALMRRFDMMTVSEPSKTQVRRILDEAVGSYVAHHEVLIEDDMLDLVVDLSARYLPAARFPDKAFNVVDTACVLAMHRGAEMVEAQDVRLAIERNGGVRLTAPSQDILDRVSGLEKALSGRVFGQPEAVEALARAVRTSLLGINRGGCAGSYLFNGPTGVGKTEMALAFAESMGLPLVRIDMSEFMERYSVSGLIGAPPGYVGYDRDGILIEAADTHSEMVLLLDEADKAHPDVYDILLQILDAGTVRSADGRRVSFARTHVILSANIGAAAAEKSTIGFGRETDEKEVVDEELKQTFRREFIGRIRNRIQFGRPDKNALRCVIEKEMQRAARRVADGGYEVVFDPCLVDFIMQDATTEYGLREVQDHIDKKIHDPLGTFLMETGARRARVCFENGAVTVRPLHDA